MHQRVVGQEIPSSCLVMPTLDSGNSVTDHREPSQRAASAPSPPVEPSRYSPTAPHDRTDAHETGPSSDSLADDGVVGDCTDQAEPFQTSASGCIGIACPLVELSAETPAATQLWAEAHATPLRALPVSPPGLGAG